MCIYLKGILRKAERKVLHRNRKTVRQEIPEWPRFELDFRKWEYLSPKTMIIPRPNTTDTPKIATLDW